MSRLEGHSLAVRYLRPSVRSTYCEKDERAEHGEIAPNDGGILGSCLLSYPVFYLLFTFFTSFLLYLIWWIPVFSCLFSSGYLTFLILGRKRLRK